jgi:hypothetical protein
VTTVANPFVHASSGFRITATIPTDRGMDILIQRDGEKLLMPFQPRHLFSGLIPFLALLGASGGLSYWRRARALLIGVGVLFAFHVGLMLVGPYLATPHERWVNRIIDVFYGFYGLVGFAALPFLLWFWLTQRTGLTQSASASSSGSP